MAETTYNYIISTDFPEGAVNTSKLQIEIQASAIVTALNRVDTSGDNIDIVFNAALSSGDKTILDGDTTDPCGGLIAAHDNTPTTDSVRVEVDNMATLANPEKDVQRVGVQPARTGYYMCDRDIKINTATMGSDSLQDLKVNKTTHQEENWGEFNLVGCYKKVDGDYVACDDQTDADSNAVLSIYDYIALNQTTEEAVEYDFKGGCLWSDSALEEPVWEHRMYAVMAPNIPPSFGGSCRFFDGYLYPYQGKWQECVNSLGLIIDPSLTVEAARIRFWFFYPAGVKQNHVLRIVTYRKPETF